ncbi:MAG: hypothetical protein JAY64_03370, partial [Candidatus Thiodiazotropha weberae]|nr:hypothetical protein [Candidatus Thiodiazotropha lotti]MCW4210184.1 hypothetical protein [Candidatus Thiodiazotropha lotti]
PGAIRGIDKKFLVIDGEGKLGVGIDPACGKNDVNLIEVVIETQNGIAKENRKNCEIGFF